MSASEEHYVAKMVLIGDGLSGKTSLINKFCEGKFNKRYEMTIGANFKVKRVNVDGEIIKIIFWDIAGQPHFKEVVKEYYRGAMGCLAIFDTTRYDAFRNIPEWINRIYNNIKRVIPTVLVGNKVDLKDEREVSNQVGRYYAQLLSEKCSEYGNYTVPYFGTSAKTGENVEAAFRKLAELYFTS